MKDMLNPFLLIFAQTVPSNGSQGRYNLSKYPSKIKLVIFTTEIILVQNYKNSHFKLSLQVSLFETAKIPNYI